MCITGVTLLTIDCILPNYRSFHVSFFDGSCSTDRQATSSITFHYAVGSLAPRQSKQVAHRSWNKYSRLHRRKRVEGCFTAQRVSKWWREKGKFGSPSPC